MILKSVFHAVSFISNFQYKTARLGEMLFQRKKPTRCKQVDFFSKKIFLNSSQVFLGKIYYRCIVTRSVKLSFSVSTCTK